MAGEILLENEQKRWCRKRDRVPSEDLEEKIGASLDKISGAKKERDELAAALDARKGERIPVGEEDGAPLSG